MTKKDSSPQDEPKPVQETTSADKQKSEYKADVSAPLPVANPPDAVAQKPNPAESYDETDRKQDEAIDSLAEQTQWIARQTKWVKYQTIAASILGAITLAVLVYHGIVMNRQSKAMKDQTDIMRGQLESMNSSSQQTQDLIEATRGTANASHDVAEQNKELVKHAGEQANASRTLADASQTQAKASIAQAEAAKQSVGAAVQGTQIAARTMVFGSQAYVTVQGASLLQYETGKRVTAVIDFYNAGNTPAYDVKIAPRAETRDTPPEVNRDALVSRLMKQGANIGPHVVFKRWESSDNALDGQNYKAIEDGTLKFYFYGLVTWRDIFKQPHYMTYCLFYKSPVLNLEDCGGEAH
jgi:hypothetical protein